MLHSSRVSQIACEQLSRCRDFFSIQGNQLPLPRVGQADLPLKGDILMRTKFLAATALAGSLAVALLMWGPAQATPAPTSTQATNGGLVTLVAQEGGGGGAGAGGGGGHVSGGGGGGPATAKGGPRGGPGMSGGPRGSHAMNERGGDRELSREGERGHADHGDRGDHGRFVERGHDHDHDFDHGGRHRVFRNGVWVWVYGPNYSYNDCGWLRVRALDTGSPYWWQRYHNCIGY